jgi:hypothetical protein
MDSLRNDWLTDNVSIIYHTSNDMADIRQVIAFWEEYILRDTAPVPFTLNTAVDLSVDT